VLWVAFCVIHKGRVLGYHRAAQGPCRATNTTAETISDPHESHPRRMAYRPNPVVTTTRLEAVTMTARKPKQSPGQRLRAEIVSEMAEAHVIPDSKEDALLDAVQTMVDRMAELDAAVTRDGPLLTSGTGVTKVHPGLVEYRQLAGTLPRMLAGIVIGDSFTGAPKDAAKQRAANARWSRRDQLRDAQAARAGL